MADRDRHVAERLVVEVLELAGLVGGHVAERLVVKVLRLAGLAGRHLAERLVVELLQLAGLAGWPHFALLCCQLRLGPVISYKKRLPF